MDLTPLFKLMADKKASDLYFTVGAPVNIKIEGILRPVNAQKLEAETVKQIAYSLMSEVQIREFEQTMEMNFACALPDVGNFRVNVFRQRGALAMVVRYIQRNIPSIDQLGLPAALKDVIMLKHGLILLVGSTGSGKSSSLAAMLDFRNENKTGHILTIEDPVEFLFEHKKSIVNQREVGTDTQSFHNALKNAMREAPDVIMIGEIRDRETMQHAITYAQTGHLCISTLHANNSYHAMNRIINFFPLESRSTMLLDLSISLRTVISQRLIRGSDGKRVAAVELLQNSTHISELIKDGEVDQIKEAMEQGISAESQTFEQALFKLVQEGKISVDEAMKNADSPTNLAWIMNNSKSKETGSSVDRTADGSGGREDLGSITISPEMLDQQR